MQSYQTTQGTVFLTDTLDDRDVYADQACQRPIGRIIDYGRRRSPRYAIWLAGGGAFWQPPHASTLREAIEALHTQWLRTQQLQRRGARCQS
ncbi:hypothetical protein H6F43_16025 [Leptolyngbya sp. FACHB-36]|uniref:hypothetical protein n=1 Tax=Leptolyngbya sp. FACHB-36 TaxID=2692808 RepID=UPI001681565B|nr:hypothetical protein [Leptolyngbya sp. FACHB-36]MBD2021688.1 hypothetical protein [Leptolyngbya sp. FACHB-36]